MADLTKFKVGDVLQKLAESEGLNVQCVGIDEDCYGFLVPTDMNFRDVARMYADVFNYQIIDGDPMVLRRLGSVEDWYVRQSECIVRGGGPSVTFQRNDPVNLPREIELGYIDPARSWQMTRQPWRHLSAPRTNGTFALDMYFALDAALARKLAAYLIYRLWARAVVASFEHQNLLIAPGDVIRLETDRGEFLMVVSENAITPARTNVVTCYALFTGAVPDLPPGQAWSQKYARLFGVNLPGRGSLDVATDIAYAPTTWDGFHSIGATVSADGATAYNSGGNSGDGILLGAMHYTGKYYFEVDLTFDQVDSIVTVDCAPGIIETYNSGGYVTAGHLGPGGSGFDDSYESYLGAHQPVYGNYYAPGTKVCFAVDCDNRWAWSRVGNGDWNNNAAADPATGVGGIRIGGSYWSYYASYPVYVYAAFLGGAGESITVHSAAPFTYDVPDGYFPGWPQIEGVKVGAILGGSGRCVNNMGWYWTNTDDGPVYQYSDGITVSPASFARIRGRGALVAVSDQGAPPVNDSFANATVVHDGDTIFGNTFKATVEAAEQPIRVYYPGGDFYDYQPYPGVWYKYTATKSGETVVSANQIDGRYVDNVMAVYTGTSLANLEVVATSDSIEFDQWGDFLAEIQAGLWFNGTWWNYGEEYTGYIRFQAVAGQTYYIRVQQLDNYVGLSFVLNVTTDVVRALLWSSQIGWNDRRLRANATLVPGAYGAKFGFWVQPSNQNYYPPEGRDYYRYGGEARLNIDGSKVTVVSKPILDHAATFNGRGYTHAAITSKSIPGSVLFHGRGTLAVHEEQRNGFLSDFMFGESAVGCDATVAMGQFLRPIILSGDSSLAEDVDGGITGDVFSPVGAINVATADRGLTLVSTGVGGARMRCSRDFPRGYPPQMDDLQRQVFPMLYYFEVTVDFTHDQSGFGMLSPEGASPIVAGSEYAKWERWLVRRDGKIAMFGGWDGYNPVWSYGWQYSDTYNASVTVDIGPLDRKQRLGIVLFLYSGKVMIRKLPDGKWNGDYLTNLRGPLNPNPPFPLQLSHIYRASGGVASPGDYGFYNNGLIPFAYFGDVNGGESVTVHSCDSFVGLDVVPPDIAIEPYGADGLWYTQGNWTRGLPVPSGPAALLGGGARIDVSGDTPLADPLINSGLRMRGVGAFAAAARVGSPLYAKGLLSGGGSMRNLSYVPYSGGWDVGFEESSASNVTLGDNDYSATHSVAAAGGARLPWNAERTDGRYYFEVVVSQMFSGRVGAINTNGRPSLDTILSGTPGITVRPGPGAVDGGSGGLMLYLDKGACPVDPNAAMTYCFALDIENRQAYVRTGWYGRWNWGYPWTNYPVYLMDKGGVVPAVAFDAASVGASVKLRLKPSQFEGVVPDGFSPWYQESDSTVDVYYGNSLSSGAGAVKADSFINTIRAKLPGAGTFQSDGYNNKAVAKTSGGGNLIADAYNNKAVVKIFAAGSLAADAQVL